MRFCFATTAHALRMAKVLKKLLAAAGIKHSLGRCQEHVATMYGYAHWHELAANAKPDGPVSMWDEDTEPAERTNRRVLFVGRLQASAGLPKELAGKIVDEMKPLGRPSHPDAGEPEWRVRMKKRKPGGWMSLEFDGRDEKIISQYRKGRSTSFKETLHRTEISLDGEPCEVMARRRGNASEYDIGKIHVVEAVMVRADKVIGYLCGAVVKGSLRMTSSDFIYVCDCVGDDEVTMAHLLNSQADGPGAIFSQGKTAFMLMKVEVASQAGKGGGQVFLEAVATIVKTTDRGFGALAIKVDPAQFWSVPPESRPSNPSYRAAVNHLSAHFVSSAPERYFGRHAKLFLVSPEPMERGAMGAMMLLGGYALGDEPDYTPSDDLMALFQKFGGFNLLDQERKERETPTDPSQPAMIKPDEFPEGFHSLHAAAIKSFKPHPGFWSHIPDDIIGVSIDYAAFPLRNGIENIAPVDAIRFRFANGSVLRLEANELPGGESFMLMPAALRGAGGLPLFKNPFTDKYSTADLACVLKVNSVLLFDGDPRAKLRWPTGTVELVRP